MERTVFAAQHFSSGCNGVCREIRPLAGLPADASAGSEHVADDYIVEELETVIY
jgi:hypothetical protein